MDQAQHADTDSVPSNSPLETRGVQRNRKLQFNLSLTGEEIYRQLKILEGLAVKTAAREGSYLDVRECVLAAEKLRTEARKQGF